MMKSYDRKMREVVFVFLFFNALSVNQWKVEVNQFGRRDREKIFP